MFGYEGALFYNLAREICQMIVRQEIKSGDKLPAVRELAKQKKINPNTVQKAYQLLEEQQIVFAIERSGKYVTKNEEKLKKLRQEILEDEINKFCLIMESFDFKSEEIINKLKEKL